MGRSRNNNKLIAKLEINLFSSLEETNRKFTETVENNATTDIFKKYREDYSQIADIILRNRQNGITSPLLESYYLEARLGELQAALNALPQEPLTEETVVNNDKKLKEITESLAKLYAEAKNFSEKQSLNKRKKLTSYLIART